MSNGLKILFIFVDGFGLGSDNPVVNPLRDSRFTNLGKLLDSAIPIDACLGVDGIPQSATGQASLLGGFNAPQAMGRHIEGFPPPRLKKLIEKENIFSKLRKLGKAPTFANAYWIDDPLNIPLNRQSVTTVMALTANGKVRHKDELLNGKAVNHDITRWTMHERGYDGPHISEEEAAAHLLTVAAEHDFTLYEYFLTDRAGHSGNPELIFQCLKSLEKFLPITATFGNHPNQLFLLCSDHGNIEDRTTRTHTLNPVPLIAIGDGAEHFQSLENLADVTPAILRLF
ncbi:peptidase [Verrucomicrobia bacterium S94]|nr:peptidase [Verrucomicrobia bacterium S94]